MIFITLQNGFQMDLFRWNLLIIRCEFKLSILTYLNKCFILYKLHIYVIHKRQRLEQQEGLHKSDLVKAKNVVDLLFIWANSISDAIREDEETVKSLSLGSYIGSDSDDDILASIVKFKSKRERTGSNVAITIRSDDSHISTIIFEDEEEKNGEDEGNGENNKEYIKAESSYIMSVKEDEI